MKGERGFLLVELLLAGVLFAFLAGSIGVVFVNTSHAVARVRKTILKMDNSIFFLARIRKDLRHSVKLSEFPFVGKPEMCRIPVKILDAGKKVRLCYVKYVFENGSVYREESPLGADDFETKEVPRQIVLKEVQSFRFLYPYLSGEEEIEFREDWREDPYYGLPAAVELVIAFKDGVKDPPVPEIVEIPQGIVAPIPEAI
ncbi:MAG: hypothetical protein V1882_02125 [Candidatus Omnitrophota bacterium]